MRPASRLAVTLKTPRHSPLLAAFPHRPEPGFASKLLGFREAYTVTPASIHTVTPALSCNGPTTNAFLLPSGASLTDWPAEQPSIAAWMVRVSSAASSASAVASPGATVLVASRVAHGTGMTGSLPMSSQEVG
jgi:hypothetical protein